MRSISLANLAATIPPASLTPPLPLATSSELWDDTTIDTRIAQQLVRTERGLQYAWAHAPRPMWIVMAGHYPIYSSGEHGDNDDLISALQPLLGKYKVHMYYCGHDHMSAHYSRNNSSHSGTNSGDKWTTHHFIAGGGSSHRSPITDSHAIAITFSSPLSPHIHSPSVVHRP
jgi:hypothetical protein